MSDVARAEHKQYGAHGTVAAQKALSHPPRMSRAASILWRLRADQGLALHGPNVTACGGTSGLLACRRPHGPSERL